MWNTYQQARICKMTLTQTHEWQT